MWKSPLFWKYSDPGGTPRDGFSMYSQSLPLTWDPTSGPETTVPPVKLNAAESVAKVSTGHRRSLIGVEDTGGDIVDV
jgi:hypothetical protein